MSCHTVPARHRQHGIALLSVLLALSLMVILASEISTAFRQQLVRSQSRQSLDQAYWYALSGEQLAIVVLQKTFAADPKTIALDQPWATENSQFPVDGGTIAGHLRDARGCFNLNALGKMGSSRTGSGTIPEVQVFEALLRYLGLAREDAGQIARSTRNWINSNEQANSGASDSDYAALPLPYLSGKAPMRDVSEWRAVAGVSQPVAERVMPFLCALPSTELAVNINTIPADQPELLAALYIDKLPVDQAARVLNNRPKSGWDTVADFLSQPDLANFASTGVNQRLTVTSQYFIATVNATAGDSTMPLSSLLMHSVGSGNPRIAVIRRQFGATY